MNDPSSPTPEDLDFREMPFHLLLDVPIDQMTDEQLRGLDKHIQELRTVPAARRARVVQESNKLEGKRSKNKPNYNLDDLL